MVNTNHCSVLEYQKNLRERLSARKIFLDFTRTKSFFLDHELAIVLVIGVVFPIWLAIYANSLKMLTVFVLYLGVHVIIQASELDRIRKEFRKEHKEEAKILFGD